MSKKETYRADREKSELLSPSKGQLRYVREYAAQVLAQAQNMEMLSALAHEGLIPAEQAQELINFQRDSLLRDLHYLTVYVKPKEENK